MSNLNLAVIGNCSFSALLDDQAKIVWSCMPRYDDDPIFCSLMDGGPDSRDRGYFDIDLEDFARSEQCYLYNSAVVVTTLYDTHGSALEITDFAPRFKQRGRTYRPVMIVRRLRAVIGNPLIRVRIKPAMDYGARQPEVTHGSNHIRYVIPNNTVRLTTDVPISFVLK